MKNFKFLLCFSAILVLLFASCEKIEVNSTKNEVPIENFNSLSVNDIDLKDIKVKDGYLTFQNLDHFKKVIEDIQKLQPRELNKLEGRLGFVSKRSIIDQALAEFSTLTEENYATEINKFKDVFEFDQEGKFIGLDFPLYYRASLLNADGIVKVGNELYIYMNDKFVSIADGDYSKVEYAKRLDNPDPEKGIWVGKITTTKSNPDMFRGTVTLHHCTSSFPPPPFYRVYTFDGKLTT